MHWGITNFKGLKSAELDLEPGAMTVLAGMNSSGKSSLLQSLLFAAQSLYHNGPVVLNGPLVRLGEASDLVRNGSPNTSIGLALEFSRSDGDTQDPTGVLKAQIDLVPSGDNVTLRPQRVRINRLDADAGGTLRLDKDHSRSGDLREVAEAIDGSPSTDILHVKSLLASEKRALRTYVSFRGLVPADVIQLHSAERIASKYRQALNPILNQLEATNKSQSAMNRLPREKEFEIFLFLREFTRLVVSELEHEDETIRSSLHPLSAARNGNPYRFESVWGDFSEEERKKAVDLAVSARARKTYVHVPLPEVSAFRTRNRDSHGLLESILKEEIHDSLQALRNLASSLFDLADKVQYLGPLRDEPRVAWNQWNELARGLPVGTRGEYCAVVLSRSAKHKLEYVGPGPTGELRQSTLDQAVNEWLAYLEIGDSVFAKSLGKLGVGVTLSVAGQRRDLTAVGVGVSQALPLVIAFLAAPKDSVFIVEQPELHLHPAVQSRLADFMLNARPDLTTIVETHSEAFLTRIRRRVAEGTTAPSRVIITFVEPSSDGAVTRNLQLSEFGDLNEWPLGFLTSGEEDTAAILRANLDRLKADASAS